MSAILGTAVTGAGGGAYTIDNSLRFRSSASAYLNRTMTTATNNLKWTWSAWVKRGTLGTTNILFNAGDGTSNDFGSIQFRSEDTLQFSQISGGAYNVQVYTTAVFRDPSAWYHVVLVYDSPNATSTDRVQIYVNGTRQTALTYATGPFAQNTSSKINSALAHYISKLDYASLYFDGYMAEVNFIDGQALTPSSFGATDASTGVWQPKAYTGSYGTNGFYLKFSDIATTSGSNAGLGKDFSGNANYWNTNNISVTSGVTYDAMTDSPTPKSSTVGNYCVLNPLRTNDGTVTNGNLTASQSANAYVGFGGSMAMRTGKWYWEVTCTSIGFVTSIGITNSNSTGGITSGIWTYHYDGTKYIGASNQAYSGNSYTSGDVLGFAFDADAGSLTCYKNNVSQGVLISGLAVDDYYAYATLYGSWNIGFNFGQRPFVYTPPSGYNRLQTYNLSTPTVGSSSTTLANKYFNAVIYTGNNGTQTIATGFQPDFTWIKVRNVADDHFLYDSVRGATKYLSSNTTGAEGTIANGLTAFASTGFTLGDSGSTNNASNNFASWSWKANGSGVTNTAGSITSTVSANTTAGFSIVTYTGNATSGATVGHGLGVAPSFIICKTRTQASVDWPTYHISTGNNGGCTLNENLAKATASTWWNNTTPSSTVVTLGSGAQTNGSTQSMVMYCFAAITGYSRFGSYTGNGSTDGPFVFTGFRPRFVMYKNSSALGAWIMYDTSRDPYNVVDLIIEAQSANAETTGSPFADIDFLSNGFKIRGTSSALNTNGNTYIYIAFAENPFNYSLAR